MRTISRIARPALLFPLLLLAACVIPGHAVVSGSGPCRDVGVNPCLSNPCTNGGDCYVDETKSGGYTCVNTWESGSCAAKPEKCGYGQWCNYTTGDCACDRQECDVRNTHSRPGYHCYLGNSYSVPGFACQQSWFVPNASIVLSKSEVAFTFKLPLATVELARKSETIKYSNGNGGVRYADLGYKPNVAIRYIPANQSGWLTVVSAQGPYNDINNGTVESKVDINGKSQGIYEAEVTLTMNNPEYKGSPPPPKSYIVRVVVYGSSETPPVVTTPPAGTPQIASVNYAGDAKCGKGSQLLIMGTDFGSEGPSKIEIEKQPGGPYLPLKVREFGAEKILVDVPDNTCLNSVGSLCDETVNFKVTKTGFTPAVYPFLLNPGRKNNATSLRIGERFTFFVKRPALDPNTPVSWYDQDARSVYPNLSVDLGTITNTKLGIKKFTINGATVYAHEVEMKVSVPFVFSKESNWQHLTAKNGSTTLQIFTDTYLPLAYNIVLHLFPRFELSTDVFEPGKFVTVKGQLYAQTYPNTVLIMCDKRFSGVIGSQPDGTYLIKVPKMPPGRYDFVFRESGIPWNYNQVISVRVPAPILSPILNLLLL